jgi:hypothetical protein
MTARSAAAGRVEHGGESGEGEGTEQESEIAEGVVEP